METLKNVETPSSQAEHNLSAYLNDHLAGSVVALELLERLEHVHAGTESAHFFAVLRADIIEDRNDLESLMKRLGVEQSLPRKVVGWLADKMTVIKLRWDDPAGGALHLLESVEAVAIGIHGKGALWRGLAVAAPRQAALQGLDYDLLERRAEEQRARIERVRLEAVRSAFGAL